MPRPPPRSTTATAAPGPNATDPNCVRTPPIPPGDRTATSPSSLPLAASHRRISASCPPVNTSLPPAANATPVSDPVCPAVTDNNLPEGTSHTTAVLPITPQATARSGAVNRISRGPDSTSPSGQSTVAASFPSAACHTCTAPSDAAAASNLPSGENATRTPLPYRPNSCRPTEPVRGSTSRTVPVPVATAAIFPSGANATTGAPYPGSRVRPSSFPEVASQNWTKRPNSFSGSGRPGVGSKWVPQVASSFPSAERATLADWF